jgi:membrane protein YdbS with pleckstrin-like domain
MKRKKRSKSHAAGDPRTVEVLTVAWMLTVVTTLACEVGFVFARWLAAGDGLLAMLSHLLLFAAFVIGLVALFVTPVVLRSRRVAPPSGVTVFALVVAAAPIVLVAIEILEP